MTNLLPRTAAMGATVLFLFPGAPKGAFAAHSPKTASPVMSAPLHRAGIYSSTARHILAVEVEALRRLHLETVSPIKQQPTFSALVRHTGRSTAQMFGSFRELGGAFREFSRAFSVRAPGTRHTSGPAGTTAP